MHRSQLNTDNLPSNDALQKQQLSMCERFTNCIRNIPSYFVKPKKEELAEEKQEQNNTPPAIQRMTNNEMMR